VKFSEDLNPTAIFSNDCALRLLLLEIHEIISYVKFTLPLSFSDVLAKYEEILLQFKLNRQVSYKLRDNW
jgi:hypothetical protein